MLDESESVQSAEALLQSWPLSALLCLPSYNNYNRDVQLFGEQVHGLKKHKLNQSLQTFDCTEHPLACNAKC